MYAGSRKAKMRVLILLALGLVAVVAVPENQQRIVGGSDINIGRYPYAAAVLYSTDFVQYLQQCGGVIITTRSIISVAQCFNDDLATRWRVRVGSSFRTIGGLVYSIETIIKHQSYNPQTLENNISILRTLVSMRYSDRIGPASIAGSNYNLADNQVVWAVGWGRLRDGGPYSEELQHVQIWTVNQDTCRSRYAELGYTVTDNMLCSGWLDVGGRDQCQGDSGGPLTHNNVVVGVFSWSYSCGHARYPGINTRVSSYTSWIQENA